MTNSLDYYRYRFNISRKTPCIVFYEDIDESSQYVILIMENMCAKYPYILCYKVDWSESQIRDKCFPDRKSSDVIYFSEGEIKSIVSAFSSDDLDNLFKTVFNECVENYKDSFKRLLKKEGKLKDKEIDIFIKHDIKKPSYNIYNDKISYITSIHSINNSKFYQSLENSNISNLDTVSKSTEILISKNNKIAKNLFKRNSLDNQDNSSFTNFESKNIENINNQFNLFNIYNDHSFENHRHKNSFTNTENQKILLSVEEKVQNYQYTDAHKNIDYYKPKKSFPLNYNAYNNFENNFPEDLSEFSISTNNGIINYDGYNEKEIQKLASNEHTFKEVSSYIDKIVSDLHMKNENDQKINNFYNTKTFKVLSKNSSVYKISDDLLDLNEMLYNDILKTKSSQENMSLIKEPLSLPLISETSNKLENLTNIEKCNIIGCDKTNIALKFNNDDLFKNKISSIQKSDHEIRKLKSISPSISYNKMKFIDKHDKKNSQTRVNSTYPKTFIDHSSQYKNKKVVSPNHNTQNYKNNINISNIYKSKNFISDHIHKKIIDQSKRKRSNTNTTNKSVINDDLIIPKTRKF